MPIHEYKCKNCGKVSEFLVRVGRGETEIKCGHCGSKELSRILSNSFISTSGHSTGSREGVPCCGRDERCDTPPCSDSGVCRR